MSGRYGARDNGPEAFSKRKVRLALPIGAADLIAAQLSLSTAIDLAIYRGSLDHSNYVLVQ